MTDIKLVNLKSALLGLIFTLPFIIVNFVVALRLEPFYAFLGSFPAIRNSSFTPLLLLLLLPIGAFIASRPMFSKGKDGKRKIYIINTIVAVILLAGFVVIGGAIGEELYRCDILKIPNCD